MKEKNKVWLETALRYLFDEISPQEFEDYINGISEDECEMESDDFFDLISRNYTRISNKKELRSLIARYSSDFKIEVAQVQSMLRSLIKENGDPAQIICGLYTKMDNHGYVHSLGIQTILGVDDLPKLTEKKNWDPEKFERERIWFNEALPKYKNMAQVILDSFESGDLKIVEIEVEETYEFRLKMKSIEGR